MKAANFNISCAKTFWLASAKAQRERNPASVGQLGLVPSRSRLGLIDVRTFGLLDLSWIAWAHKRNPTPPSEVARFV